jgi:hypothetical protein
MVPAAMRPGTPLASKIGAGPDADRRAAQRRVARSTAAAAAGSVMGMVLGGAPRAIADINWHQTSH